ncbi:MAG: DUF6266 family protein [Candidatus Pedobacter colombiensis]|uniref:DUF6266 family protein n=1 Tax=Candidatus Pedobacter colombiensis TaxID=3121371 RepID=A0AAJ5W702_9SPHI|nr:DUF6266 family protein [Pedobacter sp.]WEK19207.1 MAG: DUF6266 family protein [Pedobacter sp.]
MGRTKFGLLGPFIGKIGPLVGYIRRGQFVTRALPHPSSKPATEKQLISRKQFGMAMRFVKPINDFVNYSFHPETKGTAKIPQNAATSYFRKLAIQGDYPDYWIDFSKVIVSKGDLPLPLNPSVELSDNKLTFKWEKDPQIGYQRNDDQVLLLAYFPDTKHANFTVGGARRTAEIDVLEIYPCLIKGNPQDTVVETYIAFISNDRQQVSDSVYLGRLKL